MTTVHTVGECASARSVNARLLMRCQRASTELNVYDVITDRVNVQLFPLYFLNRLTLN